MFFGKKGSKGARRRRSKPVAPPWQDEAEAEFREVFFECKLIRSVLHSVLCHVLCSNSNQQSHKHVTGWGIRSVTLQSFAYRDHRLAQFVS